MTLPDIVVGLGGGGGGGSDFLKGFEQAATAKAEDSAKALKRIRRRGASKAAC